MWKAFAGSCVFVNIPVLYIYKYFHILKKILTKAYISGIEELGESLLTVFEFHIFV